MEFATKCCSVECSFSASLTFQDTPSTLLVSLPSPFNIRSTFCVHSACSVLTRLFWVTPLWFFLPKGFLYFCKHWRFPWVCCYLPLVVGGAILSMKGFAVGECTKLTEFVFALAFLITHIFRNRDVQMALCCQICRSAKGILLTSNFEKWGSFRILLIIWL